MDFSYFQLNMCGYYLETVLGKMTFILRAACLLHALGAIDGGRQLANPLIKTSREKDI